MKDVGLIGVMGRTAAPRIRAAGHRLFVFDVSREALSSVAGLGVTLVTSPAGVAESTDVVLMFLPGPIQVEEVVNGSAGLLAKARSGTVLVDLSTVDSGTSERMAVAAAMKSVGYLDAPVLGRPSSVGEWSLPVGGEPAHLAACVDILKLFARSVFHIGPSGCGNKVKLLNQMMFSAINGMTAEMMAVSEKVGIPARLLYDTISASQAATVSGLFRELGKRIATADYEDPTFQVDLLAKDVALALEMARQARAGSPLAKAIQEMNQMAQARGLGKRDTSEMWKIWLDLPAAE